MLCSVKKFSEMYETVYRDLYHYALCLMKNPQEAEDAVSEAVVAAYENIHKLKKEEAFRSWIFTILTNKCKKRLKKALKEEPGREEELPEQSVVPDYDLAMDVRKAFFVLSEAERILRTGYGGSDCTTVRKHRDTGQSETGKYRTVTKREKAEETFSFIPDRTCSSLCSSCNGNHSVAVWKPASWNDRL